MTQDLRRYIKGLIIVCCCLIIKKANAFEFNYVIDNTTDRNYTVAEASCYAMEQIVYQNNTSAYEFDDMQLLVDPPVESESITYCAVTPLISPDGQKAWNACLYTGSADDIYLIRRVLIFDDETGEIIYTWKGMYYDNDYWEKYKGHWLTWSLEDKVLFDRLYKSVLYPLHDFTDHQYTMPDNKEMSEEDAIIMTKRYLKEAISASYENESYLWLTVHEEIPPWMYNRHSKTKTVMPVKEWHVYCCIPCTAEEQPVFVYNDISYVVEYGVYINSETEVVTWVDHVNE